jgi:predicted Zn-dependent peptidase
MHGKQQVNLYWSWPGPNIDSDDWILWLLAQRAFGEDESSRLWQLRQKEGLAYEIWCDNFQFRDRPLAVVYMAFAKEKHPRAVSALEREVKKVLREGISAEELERVKVSFITSLERSGQTAVQRSDRLANWWLKGLSPDRRERLIRVTSAATLSSVNRVIRQTLSAERFVKVEAGAVESN